MLRLTLLPHAGVSCPSRGAARVAPCLPRPVVQIAPGLSLAAASRRSTRCCRAASGNSAAASTSTELLRSELKALEAERDTAVTTAESCSKTATKLAEMARLLEQLALDKVKNGDESGARQALAEKKSVTETMDKNSTKADINYKLAAVLAAKISSKQSSLLSQLRGSPTHPSTSSTPSPSSSSGQPTFNSWAPPPGPSPLSPPEGQGGYSSGYSGGYTGGYSAPQTPDAGMGEGGAQWKWQKSLEEAKDRLKKQEFEASRDIRMSKITAESSIMAAKERIAAQASQSVREAQERLRAVDQKSQSTISAAQARLKARDDEVLMYVRRVMSRYRAGEYVSEDELEFAFQQLERRFM